MPLLPQVEPGEPPALARLVRPLRSGVFRFSVAQFLGALVLMFGAYPFLEELPFGDIAASILMTIVLLSGALAVGSGRRQLLLAIILVAAPLAGQWMDYLAPGAVPTSVNIAAGVVFILFMMTQLFRFILRAKRVDSEVLCAGISIYFVVALAWALAYRLVCQLNPAAFTFAAKSPPGQTLHSSDALYYSIATLTTLGCNDITPVSQAARSLVSLEVTLGVLYVAVLIARLVALYSRQPPDHAATSGQ